MDRRKLLLTCAQAGALAAAPPLLRARSAPRVVFLNPGEPERTVQLVEAKERAEVANRTSLESPRGCSKPSFSPSSRWATRGAVPPAVVSV